MGACSALITSTQGLAGAGCKDTQQGPFPAQGRQPWIRGDRCCFLGHFWQLLPHSYGLSLDAGDLGNVQGSQA